MSDKTQTSDDFLPGPFTFLKTLGLVTWIEKNIPQSDWQKIYDHTNDLIKSAHFYIRKNNGHFDFSCCICGGLRELRVPEIIEVETIYSKDHMPICDCCAEVYYPDLLNQVKKSAELFDEEIRRDNPEVDLISESIEDNGLPF